MLIKLTTGLAAQGVTFDPGELIDWRCDADCKRMIERGRATEASAGQIKDAAGRIRVYTPAPATEADRWPPRPLKQLRRAGDD